jgi:hypothetical protein
MLSVGSTKSGAKPAFFQSDVGDGRALTLGFAVERTYPYVVALGVTIGWLFLGAPFPTQTDAMLGAAVTVASVFAGFLIGSKALLLSLKDSNVFRRLQEAGYMSVFIGYLKEGINSSVSFVAISMLGFFVNPIPVYASYRLPEIFSTIWIASGVIALFTCQRVSHLLFKMLRHV